MFERLIASAPARRRSAGQVLVSVTLHGAVAALAVHASTATATPSPRPRPDTINIEIIDPAPRPAEPRPRSDAPAPFAGTAPLPLPPDPIPGDVTAGIPPIDPGRLVDADLRATLAALGGADSVPDLGSGVGSDIDTARIFTAGQLDRPAEVVAQPVPHYPAVLRSAAIAGHVDVEYVVATDGAVEPATVRVLDATHPGFVESARDAVLAARFTPAVYRGRPVRQLVRQRVRFELSASAPASARAHGRGAAAPE